MKNSATPRNAMAATKIRDSRALMENAAAIAHSSITGARVHMRMIIW